MGVSNTCDEHGIFKSMCHTCRFNLPDNDPPHRSMHTFTLGLCEIELSRYMANAKGNTKRNIPTDHYDECIEWLEERIKTLKALQLLGVKV